MIRNVESGHVHFDHEHYMATVRNNEERQIIQTLRQLFRSFDINDSG